MKSPIKKIIKGKKGKAKKLAPPQANASKIGNMLMQAGKPAAY